jgi:hypothetical protein
LGSGQTEAPELSADSLCRDRIGNMQPLQWQLRFDVRKRLVNGVIGTNEKIGAYFSQLIGGGEHQLAYPLPVIAVDTLHVVSQRVSMHGDLGVIVGAEKVRAPGAYSSITESGSFRRTSDDTDMLSHRLILR